MANSQSIDLELANGVFRFALPVSAQMEIERACRAPFGEVAARIMRGRFALTETATQGLITEAQFAALDFDMVIGTAIKAGGWASLPGHPDYKFDDGDWTGWFRTKHYSHWTMEQKWAVAAAIIGAMFFGAPAASNLPKAGAVPRGDGAEKAADAAAEAGA